MSRFINVFEKEYSNEILNDCPAVMQKSRIVFDNEENRCVIQFKLMNTDTEIIEKVFLKVKLLDYQGKNIKTINEHIILTSAQQNDSFGEDSPLYYSDKNISSCEVIITKVIFKNGNVWRNELNEKQERAIKQRIITYAALVLGIMVLFNVVNIFLANNSYHGFDLNGIAIISNGNKDSMINRLGFVLKRADKIAGPISPSLFSDGTEYYAVNKNGKWGVVNKYGIWVVKPTYTSKDSLERSPEYKELLHD